MADPKAATILLQATLLVALGSPYARVASRAVRTWVFATVGLVLMVQLVAVVTLYVGSPLLRLSDGDIYSVNAALLGAWLTGVSILGYERGRLSRPRLHEVLRRTSLPTP